MEREASIEVRFEQRPPRLATARLDRQELAAVFAGGCLGALARAALAQSLVAGVGEWPWAIFAVNLVGAAMLGFFITRVNERLAPSQYARAFLASGVCGALTTFSTMVVELVQMLEAAHVALAAAYGCASVAGGLAAVFISTKLVRRARWGA